MIRKNANMLFSKESKLQKTKIHLKKFWMERSK